MGTAPLKQTETVPKYHFIGFADPLTGFPGEKESLF